MVIEREESLRKKYYSELLEPKEIDIIEDLIVLLNPFKELTLLISASTYVTSSIILPAVSRLIQVLQSYESLHKNDSIENLGLSMKVDLIDRTTKYFNNKLLLAATFMDPRYRSFQFIKDEQKRDKSLFEASAYIKNLYKYKM